MKILFLSHRIPWPLKDGGALAIHNNLKGFVDAGQEVKLLCLNPLKDGSSLEAVPQWMAKTLPEAFSIDTSISPTAAFLNLFGNASYHVTRFFDRSFEQRLGTLLQNESFDVVHMEGAFIGQYAPLIRSLSKACLVLREHNVEYRIWEKMAASASGPKKVYLQLLSKRLKKYEEQLWQKVDMVEAISEEDCAEFRKWNGNSFTGGAGFELEPYLNKSQQPIRKSLFHLGSMDWLPNQEAVQWLLDDIWPAIHLAFPEWKLFLAGKKMPESWKKKDGALQVEGEVESAIDYMAGYEVMLVPLKSGSGIRMKTLEAMALGKTVISTTLGLSGIDFVPGKEVLVANTPEQFVEALRWLENQPELLNTIGEAAREKVKSSYANEKHIGRLLEKYRNCKP